MNTNINENESSKLSDVIYENDEILSNVNNFMKELKDLKQVDKSAYDSYLKKGNELLNDVNDIIEVIKSCNKANDTDLQTFEIYKESSITKAENTKKLLEESIMKLNRIMQKNSEKTNIKQRGILKKSVKSKEKSNIKNKEDMEKESITKSDMHYENNNKGKDLTFDNYNGNVNSEKVSSSSNTNCNRSRNENNINEIGMEQSSNSIDNNIENLKSKLSNLKKNKKKNIMSNENINEKNIKKFIEKDKNQTGINVEESNKEDKMFNVINKKDNGVIINEKLYTENVLLFSVETGENKNDVKDEVHDVNKTSDDNPNYQSTSKQIEIRKTFPRDQSNLSIDNFETVDEECHNFIIIKSFIPKEEDDFKGLVGEEVSLIELTEDDWCFVKDSHEKTGYIPRSCLESIPRENQDIKGVSIHRNSEDFSEKTILWDQIKQSLQDKNISDLLKSVENMPSGFRYSTLYGWSRENFNKLDVPLYLCPKLSESQLSFCDLVYNQLHPVRFQRHLQILKVFQLPLISEKFIVKSRHIRICLFDGTKAVSNIHVMRASVNEKDLKTWHFNSKINEATKSMDYNEIFFRFDHIPNDITILLEFCILGSKLKSISLSSTSVKAEESFTEEDLKEISIGWSIIPIYENNGLPINNKKADYLINGGTPFEKDIEVDEKDNRKDSTSKIKSIINQNKQPQVAVRISNPNKENNDLLETLPSNVIGSSLNINILSFYRKILGEEILNCCSDLTSANSLYSPFLVSLRGAMKYSDFLDILRTTWNEKLKITKSINKKNYKETMKLFQKVYMDYLHPVTKISEFSAGHGSKQIQEKAINLFTKKIKQDNLLVLLSDEYIFSPFTFEEMEFNMKPIC